MFRCEVATASGKEELASARMCACHSQMCVFSTRETENETDSAEREREGEKKAEGKTGSDVARQHGDAPMVVFVLGSTSWMNLHDSAGA